MSSSTSRVRLTPCCLAGWFTAALLVLASVLGGLLPAAAMASTDDGETAYTYDAPLDTPLTALLDDAVRQAATGLATPGRVSTQLTEASLRHLVDLVAPSSADDLLGQARAARNATADEVGSRTATVTGGYDPATGRVVSGCSSNPVGCAELDVVRQLDIDPADVRFTEALRPRTGGEVPVCHLCQDQFSPSQFPPGVQVLPNGPWGPR